MFSGSDFCALEDYINTLLTRDPNKIKVLITGVDGHMYRTVNYWTDEFDGLYRTCPKDVKAYKANVGGSHVYFLSTDSIEYLGKVYTGESLYEILSGT